MWVITIQTYAQQFKQKLILIISPCLNKLHPVNFSTNDEYVQTINQEPSRLLYNDTYKYHQEPPFI